MQTTTVRTIERTKAQKMVDIDMIMNDTTNYEVWASKMVSKK